MNQRGDDTAQSASTLDDGPQRAAVELLARERLAEECAYSFYFNRVTFSYSQGILTLEGRLPSFYLKQVLQTLLRDLDGVAHVNNRVDVVSSTGLSSARRR